MGCASFDSGVLPIGEDRVRSALSQEETPSDRLNSMATTPAMKDAPHAANVVGLLLDSPDRPSSTTDEAASHRELLSVPNCLQSREAEGSQSEAIAVRGRSGAQP